MDLSHLLLHSYYDSSVFVYVPLQLVSSLPFFPPLLMPTLATRRRRAEAADAAVGANPSAQAHMESGNTASPAVDQPSDTRDKLKAYDKQTQMQNQMKRQAHLVEQNMDTMVGRQSRVKPRIACHSCCSLVCHFFPFSFVCVSVCVRFRFQSSCSVF